MSKLYAGVILSFLIIFSLGGVCEAKEVVKINDLIENSKLYDGKQITVEGEAIGEAMERGSFSWVNINDQSNALGIWMPNEDADKIKFYGDYKHLGDEIRVTGIFNRACEQHGGDMDIHSATVEVLSSGKLIEVKVNPVKTYLAILLSVITLIISGVYLKALRS